MDNKSSQQSGIQEKPLPDKIQEGTGHPQKKEGQSESHDSDKPNTGKQ